MCSHALVFLLLLVCALKFLIQLIKKRIGACLNGVEAAGKEARARTSKANHSRKQKQTSQLNTRPAYKQRNDAAAAAVAVAVIWQPAPSLSIHTSHSGWSRCVLLDKKSNRDTAACCPIQPHNHAPTGHCVLNLLGAHQHVSERDGVSMLT